MAERSAGRDAGGAAAAAVFCDFVAFRVLTLTLFQASSSGVSGEARCFSRKAV